MLTLSRLHELSRDENPLALLDAVLANGRPLALAARLRLEHPEVAPVVGLALGLRRFLELTYAWSGPAAEMCERLLLMETPGGGFGSVVATAAARSALARAAESCQRGGEEGAARGLGEVVEACDRVLREAQRESGEGLVGDATDSTLILWLLSDDLWEAERGGAGLDAGSLWRGLEKAGAMHDRVLGALLEAARPVIGATARAA